MHKIAIKLEKKLTEFRFFNFRKNVKKKWDLFQKKSWNFKGSKIEQNSVVDLKGWSKL